MGDDEARFQGTIFGIRDQGDIRLLADYYLQAQVPAHRTLIEQAFVEAMRSHYPIIPGPGIGDDDNDDSDLTHVICKPGLTPAMYKAAMNHYAVFMPDAALYFFLKLDEKTLPEPVRTNAEETMVLAATQNECGTTHYLERKFVLPDKVYAAILEHMVKQQGFSHLLEEYDRQPDQQRKTLTLQSIVKVLNSCERAYPFNVSPVYLRTDLGDGVHAAAESALVRTIQTIDRSFTDIMCVFRDWDKMSEPIRDAAIARTYRFIAKYKRGGDSNFGLSYVLECPNVPLDLKAKAQHAKEVVEARERKAAAKAAEKPFDVAAYLHRNPLAGDGVASQRTKGKPSEPRMRRSVRGTTG